ncbi:hypothetical protein CMUS01_15167 [Colletotrichum musicola]|uniref:Uncharacterized protein n=1 Tax=Colletotrichum musicola TaxID=2175873 RepID=A0A8H6IYS4_9PEZI|nr:hypothetical protein CMUS01_15167 [Colletotrichum musicola]
MNPVCPELVAPNSTCTAGKNGPPSGTPDFASQNPPLWPEHRRLEVTSIILNGLLLIGCALRLFSTTNKRYWKSKNGGLRKTDVARAKSWLWVLERLFVTDLCMTILRSCVAIWISRHTDSVPTHASKLYFKFRDIDCFFLFLTHTGIIFLLAEVEIVIWGPVGERPVGNNFWYFLNRICHVSGWLMAFGVTTIQLSVSLLKMYRHFGLPGSENLQRLGSGQDVVSDGMIKILLFFVGYVVFAPYYVLVCFSPPKLHILSLKPS